MVFVAFRITFIFRDFKGHYINFRMGKIKIHWGKKENGDIKKKVKYFFSFLFFLFENNGFL